MGKTRLVCLVVVPSPSPATVARPALPRLRAPSGRRLAAAEVVTGARRVRASRPFPWGIYNLVAAGVGSACFLTEIKKGQQRFMFPAPESLVSLHLPGAFPSLPPRSGKHLEPAVGFINRGLRDPKSASRARGT